MNPICLWSLDDIGGDSCYDTECGRMFEISNDDTLEENGFKFCCFCGKPLEEIRTSEADD